MMGCGSRRLALSSSTKTAWSQPTTAAPTPTTTQEDADAEDEKRAVDGICARLGLGVGRGELSLACAGVSAQRGVSMSPVVFDWRAFSLECGDLVECARRGAG